MSAERVDLDRVRLIDGDGSSVIASYALGLSGDASKVTNFIEGLIAGRINAKGEAYRRCLRAAGEKRVAVHVECPRLVFAGSASERVVRCADLHVDESGFFEHVLPTRTG